MNILKNCYVINLEKNTDRMRLVEKELSKINVKANRFNAIYNEQGFIGCTMSHIECLKLAKQRKLPHVMIWEDDSMFIPDKKVKQFLKCVKEFNTNIKDWDVLLLSANNFQPFIKLNEYFIQVKNAQCTNAYIVKNHYFQKMIDIFSISLKISMDTKNKLFSLDNIWKFLQKRDKWYMIYSYYIMQRSGYSDVENKETNYESDFSCTEDRYAFDIKQDIISVIEKEWQKKYVNKIIPKRIYQVYDESKETNSWKDLNPNYEYISYSEKDMDLFVKNNFSEKIYNTYSMASQNNCKIDLWKYCILYLYGGVFVKTGTTCLNKIDNFLYDNTEFISCIEKHIYTGSHNLYNGFVGCIPGSKIAENCINILVYQIDNNLITNSYNGYGILGQSTNVYLKRNEFDFFNGQEGSFDKMHFLSFEKGLVKNFIGDKLMK